MDNNEMDQVVVGKSSCQQGPPHKEAHLPPWIFHHNELISALASAGHLKKKKLINVLNYMHFKGDHIYVLLNHPLYEEGVLIKVHPEPCFGDELICRWDQAYTTYKLDHYHFQFLIIPYDQSVILVPARMLVINDDGLTVPLPETSLIVSTRQTPRFACHDVKAELWQNGFQAEGDLIDFSPHSFRVRVQATPPSSFHWFNVGALTTIHLSAGTNILYSGNCICVMKKQEGHSREIVATPTDNQIQRFKAKESRNPRRQTSPPFYAIFEHPFIKKQVQREIFDISTSGFSIYDKSGEAVLIPGMIIPDMTITYAGILKIECKVQVIYGKEEESVRFGMTILDMNLKNYNCLSQLLNNIPGIDQIITNEVDLDQLWELFFDSDFIYPEKYKHIQTYRKSFKETYRKLYEESPEIAKHFTYQKNGRIFSHISLIRAYERTWMAHHHAARVVEGRHTGFIVLKQMICYLNDMHRLPSANLDYCMCYYRPGNKFTDRIYSGFAKEKSNPELCSVDSFAYINYATKQVTAPLPAGWTLRACSASDLWEFEQFYKHHSGGLLLNVLSLDHHSQEGSLEQLYAKLGFIRRWKAFALHYVGELKAVIVAEESDVAINLSDLLNGFKIFIMDPAIQPEIIYTVVGTVAKDYPMDSFSLLIYPADYIANRGLDFEKQYLMWILDAQIGTEFVEYLGRRFRMKLA